MSVAAEIIARKWGGFTQPLSETDSPVHNAKDGYVLLAPPSAG